MYRTLLKWMTEASSRKWISRTTGALAKSAWSRRLIPRFAALYRISLEEAEKELGEYATLNDFFTRRLKTGARLIEGGTDDVVSPVDARITGCGRVENGTLLNVKGQDYTVDDLLSQSPRAVNYQNGYYYVLYLSPSDYHRIHAPVDGTVVEKDRVPGRVYPVNEFGLTRLTRVLSRNERAMTYIRHEYGEIAVVKVGAMNVSGIVYADPLPNTLTRGAELARFEFGSTVVLLMENGIYDPDPSFRPGDAVKMGQSLGKLHAKQ